MDPERRRIPLEERQRLNLDWMLRMRRDIRAGADTPYPGVFLIKVGEMKELYINEAELLALQSVVDAMVVGAKEAQVLNENYEQLLKEKKRCG